MEAKTDNTDVYKESILKHVKARIGLGNHLSKELDKVLLVRINCAFGDLSLLGIGSDNFSVNENTSWLQFPIDKEKLPYVVEFIVNNTSRRIDGREFERYKLTDWEKIQCAGRWLNALYFSQGVGKVLEIPEDSPCNYCPVYEYKCRYYRVDPSKNFAVLENFAGPYFGQKKQYL